MNNITIICSHLHTNYAAQIWYIIVPIIKNNQKNHNNSSNYRPIARIRICKKFWYAPKAFWVITLIGFLRFLILNPQYRFPPIFEVKYWFDKEVSITQKIAYFKSYNFYGTYFSDKWIFQFEKLKNVSRSRLHAVK